MSIDVFMDEFGHDLRRAARARARRRRALRLALAVPAGAGIVLALTLPRGGEDLDAVAAARAALAPDGEIVHMTIEFRTDGVPTLPLLLPVEQWYAADPERWRTRQVIPASRSRAPVLVDRRGRITGRVETAYANGRMRFYSAQRDVVTIQRDFARPEDFGPGIAGGDPATELREELAAGGVRDGGVVSVDGRRVRRLVSEGDRGIRFEYFMDPETFAPYGGRVTVMRAGRARVSGPEFRITSYERIPLTPQTERLLRIEKTPNTKFVWMDVKRP